MARPTNLTPELMTGIVTLIQQAVEPSIVAQAYGVDHSTYYQWISRGEGTDPTRTSVPIYVEFADAVRQAEYQAESTLVVTAIGKVKTTADAVLLPERRFPERWKRREELTINIRREAEKIAAETGLDVDDIMAEAELVLAGYKR